MNGHQELGSCAEFDVFLKDQIPITLITQYPVSMTLYSMSGDEMLGLSHRSDPWEVRDAMKSVRCENSDVLRSLLSRLKSLSISQPPTSSNSSYQCGGDTWTVLRCGSTSSSVSNLLLCSNCSQLLTNYCALSPSARSDFLSASPASHASISCSDPPSDPLGQLSMLYVQFNEQSPPPSFSSREVISVTNTSVAVRVIMNDKGYLLCGSFLPPSAPLSSDVLSFPRIPLLGAPLASPSPFAATSTVATYFIGDLNPSSSYDIYCTSLSLTAAPMPTERMLDSKMPIQTLCCRSLSVTLNQRVVDDVSVLGFALTLDVGSQRVDDLLEVSISGVDMNTLVLREMFAPSLVTFSLSSSLKVDLTYLPVLTGSYRLNVTLTGPSSSNYRVVFPAGDVLVVNGVEEALSPPLIQRSEFSSDGRKIRVTFNSPTNRGGVDVFNAALWFSSSSPLSPSLVRWVSNSSLEISAAGAAPLSLNVKDVLKLKKGVLKARCTSTVDRSCSSWRSNDSQNSTIFAPSVAMTPVVTMWLASVIGPCDDLIVDLTSSSGSGGRLWKSVSFTVLGSDPNISLIQGFLTTSGPSIPSLMKKTFVLPNRVLTPGYGYSVEARLCNFLNSCGIRLKSFVVSSSPEVPVVLLNSQNKISLFRNATLAISGDGYLPKCGVIKSRTYLQYTWSLFENQVLQTSRELQSISVNPLEFKLPSFRLGVGSLYVVKLTVKHTKSLKVSSSSVEVFVNSGKLRCELSAGEDLGLRMDGSLVLDLSSSSDSNVDPTSADAGLLFEMICFRVAPSYHETCDALIFTPLTSSRSQFVVTVNSSVATAAADDVFTIVMRGRSSFSSANNAQDNRRCERVLKLSILDSLAPLVRLETLSGSGSRINPSSKLKILATVNMISRGDLTWSLSDESIHLSSVSLSPISRTLPPSPSNSSHVLSLVLVGNSLPPQSSFIVTLRCSLANGYFSSSSVTITTNSPPFGGALEVSPVKGVMLQTLFSMFGLGWVDEDLPLSYQFGYLSSTSFSSSSQSNNHTDMIVLRSKIELSYTSTLLPSGSSPALVNETNSNLTAHSNLSCVVLVFDAMDSSSSSLFDVLVKEVETTTNDLKEYLLFGINTTQLTSNSEDLKNTLSSTSTVLNRVDCSRAPDCDKLNRKKCSTTKGTCGECLFGFVGLMGTSNTRCESSNTLSRRLLAHSSSATSTPPTCSRDADCEASGLFLECNPQSHLCQAIQQSCPNSCSGHGQCVFVLKYDPAESVSECGLMDLDCVPRCDCDEGYVGSSCSLTSSEMLKEMDVRQLLVESLGALMSVENPWKTNVKSWMNILSVVASDPLSLSDESKKLLTILVIEILKVAREVALSAEDLSEVGMNQVVDMSMSRLFSSISQSRGNTTTTEADLSTLFSLLNEYSRFVTSDMLENQFPVSSITPYLRSSSFYLSSTSANSSSSPLSLSIPETDLEKYLRDLNESSPVQQSIELSSGILYPLQISISQTLFEAITLTSSNSTDNTTVFINQTQISPPLVVTLQSPPCSSASPNQSDPCFLRVLLRNKIKKSTALEDSKSLAFSLVSSSFEVDCVAGLVEDHYYVCPSGDVLTISCNGSSSLKGRQSCPQRSREVGCHVAYPSSSSSSRAPDVDVSCQLEEQNSSMTICICDLSHVGPISGDGDSAVSFSILSIQKSVVTDFVSTWETAGTLSSADVAGSWVVLLTVGSVGVTFLLMLLIGIAFDSDEADQKFFESDAKSKSWISTQILILQSAFKAFVDSLTGQVAPHRSAEIPSGMEVIERIDEARHSMKFIDDSLPSIFKSDSLWTKFKEEVKVYHRWLGIVFYYSPEFPRAMRVLSLFSSIVIMLFVQSVTYNIADPDDGSCESCEDETCCSSLKSTLNSNENRCYWSSATSLSPSPPINVTATNGSCYLRQIRDDMTRMFIVAMISAVVSAPFALGIQYLTLHVLSKETRTHADERKLQAVTQRSLSRRLGVGPDPASGGIQEDQKNFSREWSAFYSHLLSDNPALAVSFRSAWGPLDEPVQDNQQQQSFLSSLCSLADSSSAEVNEEIVNELLIVKNHVSQEATWFKAMRGNDSVSILARKRLIFLFIRDLLDGVSGEVLSNKEHRESVLKLKTMKVSGSVKAFTWLFVFLMNFGMLFYVYLFAMTQTQSRQAAWFQSFVIWLIFEIFVSSTGLVLFFHLLIPLYVFTEVSKIKEKVIKDLTSFRRKIFGSRHASQEIAPTPLSNREEATTPQAPTPSFNAAKHLFTSWRVASLFPELPESGLILQFSTPWPKKRYGDEELEVAREYDQAVILTAISRVLVYFLTALLGFHSLVQDTIVQMASDSGFAYLCLLLIRLYNFNLYLLIAVVVMFFLSLHLIMRAFRRPIKLKSTPSDSSDSSHVPTFDDEEMQQRSRAGTGASSGPGMEPRSPYHMLILQSPPPLPLPLPLPLSLETLPVAPSQSSFALASSADISQIDSEIYGDGNGNEDEEISLMSSSSSSMSSGDCSSRSCTSSSSSNAFITIVEVSNEAGSSPRQLSHPFSISISISSPSSSVDGDSLSLSLREKERDLNDWESSAEDPSSDEEKKEASME
jgi:hypothetical protein